MKNSGLHRDFSFEEWSELSFEEKREVWNHYWNPYEPDKGRSARRAIINEFCKINPDIVSSALEIGFGYFGRYVGCIYVITDGSMKVPKHFSDVPLNKGTIIKKVSENTVYVKWRDVGGSDRNFKLKVVWRKKKLTTRRNGKECFFKFMHSADLPTLFEDINQLLLKLHDQGSQT